MFIGKEYIASTCKNRLAVFKVMWKTNHILVVNENSLSATGLKQSRKQPAAITANGTSSANLLMPVSHATK